MRIKKFVIGMVGTNCYVVYNENTKECFVVDPAAPSAPLVEFIQTEGLQLQGILLTHGHFDHIMGIDTLRREWSVPVYASAREQKILTDADAESVCCIWTGYVFADAKYVKDGAVSRTCRISDPDDLHSGAYGGRMLLLYRRRGGSFQRRYTVSGSVGRTDFPTGSMSTLVRSVKERLLSLPEDTQVYPGHMEATTIGFEKENNPFL